MICMYTLWLNSILWLPFWYNVWNKLRWLWYLKTFYLHYNYYLLQIWLFVLLVFWSLLHQVAAIKGNEKIASWSDNIINHFWFCCAVASECDDQAKATSILKVLFCIEKLNAIIVLRTWTFPYSGATDWQLMIRASVYLWKKSVTNFRKHFISNSF